MFIFASGFIRAARSALLLIFLLLGSFAAYWNIVLARADWLSREDSLPARSAATALAPGDARNWIRLAHLQQQNGIDAVPAYTRAAQASPLDVNAWIGLGLEREFARDFPSAEQSLLHAAAISREYVPRWTLLNFYFRRDDAAHFRPWARQALSIGSGDLQPIYRMAWALGDNPDRISREVLPDRAPVLGQYLVWLTSADKLEPAANIFSRLIGIAGVDEIPSLLYYCNAQLAKGQVELAKTAWTGIVSRHLIPAAEDLKAEGLVNNQFTRDSLNSGFDWRIPTLDGLIIRTTFPGLRINFSGKEPEACEPVSQYVALEGERKYQIAYEYRTAGIPPHSGLTWRVFDARTGSELTNNPPSLAREQMGWESIIFATPAHCSGGRLALSYRRALGTTRINGWLQLKHVALRAAD